MRLVKFSRSETFFLSSVIAVLGSWSGVLDLDRGDWFSFAAYEILAFLALVIFFREFLEWRSERS